LAMTSVSPFHQGDCVTLVSDSHTYQVVGIDDSHNRCWAGMGKARVLLV